MKLETETEVRSKNTPAITDYHHGWGETQQNENLRNYNFKVFFRKETALDIQSNIKTL